MPPTLDDAELRRFLLGTMTEEQLDAIGLRLLDDPSLSRRLDLEEEALMHEWLNDALTPDERARFGSHFLTTRDRRERLEVIRGVRTIARETDTPRSARVVEPAGRASWWTFPRVVGLATAAACGLLLAGSSVYLLREVARLRASLTSLTASLRTAPPEPETRISFALSASDITRGPAAGPTPTLRVPTGVSVVELELRVPDDAAAAAWSIDIAVPPQTVWGAASVTAERGVLTARVPAVALPPGRYVATATLVRDPAVSLSYPFQIGR